VNTYLWWRSITAGTSLSSGATSASVDDASASSLSAPLDIGENKRHVTAPVGVTAADDISYGSNSASSFDWRLRGVNCGPFSSEVLASLKSGGSSPLEDRAFGMGQAFRLEFQARSRRTVRCEGASN
jgi:hypothetical protein